MDLPRITLKDGTAKLRGFSKSISGDPCVAKEVLFNITWDRFGVTFRLIRLVVVIHIIRTKAIQGHMWPPTIVPDFEFVAQFGQMIYSFDDGDSFQPFVFQGLIGSFRDSDGALFTNWASQLPIQVVQQLAGHSDISTTRKYYLTVRSEDMVSANKVINRIFTESSAN